MLELMVVVLVIATLLTIAIPTFLGARERAANTRAKALLHHGLQAARVVLTDDGTYLGHVAADLDAVTPELGFVDETTTAAADQNETSVRIDLFAGDPYVLLTSFTSGGNCYAILDVDGSFVGYQKAAAAATCAAQDFNPDPAVWSSTWPG